MTFYRRYYEISGYNIKGPLSVNILHERKLCSKS
jgi:hypothetical protein